MSETIQARFAWQVYSLILLAWLISIAELAFSFFLFLGAALSPGAPHCPAWALFILGSGPAVVFIIIITMSLRWKVTVWRLLAIFIPALLAVAEFAFMFFIWYAG